MKVLVLYWSATGNTEKVARTVVESLQRGGIEPDVVKIPAADDIDLLTYDLVFLGVPSYQFLPPDPVIKFVKSRMKMHNEHGDIKLKAPAVPGRNGVVFCTYSGPHTGIDEAIPVGKYLGQFFAHIGFTLRGEWYTIGEFHNNMVMSTEGRLGDILGRPNDEDLDTIRKNVQELLASIGIS